VAVVDTNEGHLSFVGYKLGQQKKVLKQQKKPISHSSRSTTL
jgi:hypothetical protein